MGQTERVPIMPGSISATDLAEFAGIKVTQCNHQTVICKDIEAAGIAATPTTREITLGLFPQGGTIAAVYALLDNVGTVTDIDFDINVDGVSALGGGNEINITNSDTSGEAKKANTISNAVMTAGNNNHVTAQCTVTSSTGALGAMIMIVVNHPSIAG